MSFSKLPCRYLVSNSFKDEIMAKLLLKESLPRLSVAKKKSKLGIPEDRQVGLRCSFSRLWEQAGNLELAVSFNLLHVHTQPEDLWIVFWKDENHECLTKILNFLKSLIRFEIRNNLFSRRLTFSNVSWDWSIKQNSQVCETREVTSIDPSDW